MVSKFDFSDNRILKFVVVVVVVVVIIIIIIIIIIRYGCLLSQTFSSWYFS